MKVTIRSLKVEDAVISWKWRNNPVIWKLTGRNWNDVVTHEIEKKWISNGLLNNEFRFAICVGEDMKYIGNAQLTNIIERKAQYHLFIGETEYWGKGIGTKVAELVKYQAFNVLELLEIYSYFKPENKSSIKACEKNGFIFKDIVNGEIVLSCISGA